MTKLEKAQEAYIEWLESRVKIDSGKAVDLRAAIESAKSDPSALSALIGDLEGLQKVTPYEIADKIRLRDWDSSRWVGFADLQSIIAKHRGTK